MKKKMKYLYYPGDSSQGIDAVLCMTENLEEAFRNVLVNDKLCEDNDEGWAHMLVRIRGYNTNGQEWNWKDPIPLSKRLHRYLDGKIHQGGP